MKSPREPREPTGGRDRTLQGDGKEVGPIGGERLGAVFGADFPALLETLGGEVDFVAAEFLIQAVNGGDGSFFSGAVFEADE